MTDLLLMGIFLLCIALGYIVVKRSGGFLEHMLFRDSDLWYNLRESNEPCRTETGADAGACSREDASGRRKIGRSNRSSQENDAAPARGPRAERIKSYFGLGTAQKPEQVKTSASPEKQSFFGLGTAQKTVSPDKQTEPTIRKGLGAVRQSISARAEKRRASGEGSHRSKDYRPEVYKPKDYKAGIKHEWKTN